jgi:hypothetical protein
MVATITTNKNLSKLLTSTFKFDIRRLGNCIRGVMVGVLASGVVDHRFEFCLGQNQRLLNW